jgi:hypothetical protein
VLKSRRGLLAAGLAVAVVGTIGVASTISAGAEEIGEPPAAAPAVVEQPAAVEQSAAVEPSADGAVAAESTAPVDVTTPTKLDTNAKPPTVLPWGSRPQRIKKGRPGLSSKALRGSGADVAPADTSGSLVPEARSAPKGRTGSTSFVRSEVIDSAPPEPAPAPTATAEPDPEECPTEKKQVCYLYNVGMQEADTEGAYGTMYIGKPTLESKEYHSLAEVAVQSKDEKQIVEIGWHVDYKVNKDYDPHLFVYRWVNRETSCYNGCGFVQVSKNIKPGDTLVNGVAKKFGIQFFDNKWWVAYDSEWVGYYPETIWTDRGITFNRSGYIQVFGEIAGTDDLTCTQMGTGKLPSGDTEKESAYIAAVGFLDGPPVSLYIYTSHFGYEVKPLSGNRSFRYGGPTERVKNAMKCSP